MRKRGKEGKEGKEGKGEDLIEKNRRGKDKEWQRERKRREGDETIRVTAKKDRQKARYKE